VKERPVTETPAAPPEAEAGGPLTHIEHWFAREVAPDIADIRIKAENAITAARKVAPAVQELASVVTEALKALDPADAPAAAGLIARAEAVLAEAVRIGAEIAPDL
jgi:hypothetical protein